MLADSLPEAKKKVGSIQQNAIRLIFFILLLDVVGITLLYPVMTYIVGRYSSDALTVTLMTVIYAAAQFFAAPALGKISDRYGRRRVLLVSVMGSAIGYLIFGIGGSLAILFISRLVDGISAGNMSTASAYIADISPPEKRAENFALVGIAWGVGLIVGPAIGSASSQISLDAPALIAAGLSLIAFMLAWFFLPESLPAEKRETQPLKLSDFNPIASILDVARIPHLSQILLALCLFNFAFNGINSTQTLFMIQKFDIQPSQTGLMLVIIGVLIALLQTTLIRYSVQRYGEKRVAVASLSLQVLMAMIAFTVSTLELIFVVSVLLAIISSFSFPTLTTLAINRVTPADIGRLMGVTTALTSLMNIAGPFAAGVVYDYVLRGAPYWLSALTFALGAAILIRTSPAKIQA